MSTEEKREKASPYKLEQARKKGQIAKSNDFNSLGGILVFLLSLCFLFGFIGVNIKSVMQEILVSANLFKHEHNFWVIKRVFSSYLTIVMPVMLISLLVSVVFNLLQTRGLISFYPLKPDIKKIDPIKGFKKLFSMKAFFELVKNSIRIGVLIALAYYMYFYVVKEVHVKGISDINGFLKFTYDLILSTIFLFLIVMMPFVIIDFRFQNWSFLKQMRMSKKEVKDEYKNQEGDPEIKQKRKKRQRELSEKLGSLSNVSSADVIVTNPIHIAVALKFNKDKMLAPKVVAKGKGNIAERIKDIAKENEIVTKVDIPLARKIYKEVGINSEIPPDIYDEVATIYRWLYSLEK
ncbi:EscU/YscU/HrcU family type III secretion system export apparatus switch protein [Vibrio sp. Of14-4]|uniref:Flagellar biosynthetic protein FlhB n=1 Tax=Vibrio tetraodonis subsp. pristinus TaxID=2695891 RepID=A0A6L8LXV0_9VIBR|nr:MULTISPECIES: EscU/YscU/HrcU family type III secretion system export apparatus switch protein [Vibrio]MCG7489159.1 EscU/YscU/HrcU family type III secretion system export apparatus switch protein [Vibrio sp. Of14-4]MYM60635.1 flagellar type III secretion system protein FlhB [Vibrio tetraodonis subsp. pristinus]